MAGKRSLPRRRRLPGFRPGFLNLEQRQLLTGNVGGAVALYSNWESVPGKFDTNPGGDYNFSFNSPGSPEYNPEATDTITTDLKSAIQSAVDAFTQVQDQADATWSTAEKDAWKAFAGVVDPNDSSSIDGTLTKLNQKRDQAISKANNDYATTLAGLADDYSTARTTAENASKSATDQAHAAHDAANDSANQAYQQAVADADAEFETARNLAQATYDNAVADADAHFNADRAAAQNQRDLTVSSATSAYNVAHAVAQAAYDATVAYDHSAAELVIVTAALPRDQALQGAQASYDQAVAAAQAARDSAYLAHQAVYDQTVGAAAATRDQDIATHQADYDTAVAAALAAYEAGPADSESTDPLDLANDPGYTSAVTSAQLSRPTMPRKSRPTPSSKPPATRLRTLAIRPIRRPATPSTTPPPRSTPPTRTRSNWRTPPMMVRRWPPRRASIPPIRPPRGDARPRQPGRRSLV